MTIKQLNQIIEEGEALKTIAQVYTDIASAKLKKIRNAVEANRFFLNELTSVYKVVKEMGLRKGILPKKNNKTISILITSNYHFYGDINNKLIKFYLNNIPNLTTDQIIIGQTAVTYLQEIDYLARSPIKYAPFILQSDYPKLDELNKLVSVIQPYQQILVFYSELKTVMTQIPRYKDITQNPSYQAKMAKEEKLEPIFIFEPELKKILDFFESQVTNLLLQQAFLESELARTGSRLVSMDQAQTNAEDYLREQRKTLFQLKKTISNSRLLETFTALRKDRSNWIN